MVNIKKKNISNHHPATERHFEKPSGGSQFDPERVEEGDQENAELVGGFDPFKSDHFPK